MKIATSVMVVLNLIAESMVSSQIITQSTCASFGAVPVANFKKDIYDGQWFMHQQYDWTQSVNYDCYLQIRTLRPDGNHNITELLVKPGALPNFQSAGVTTFDMTGLGHYIYSNPTHPEWGLTPHFILGTDYFTYATEMSCQPVVGGNEVYVYVLSRAPVVTLIKQSEIDRILDRFHINRTEISWRTLNITSCPLELLNVARGPGLLESVFKIVEDLVDGVGSVVGGLLGGLGGILG